MSDNVKTFILIVAVLFVGVVLVTSIDAAMWENEIITIYEDGVTCECPRYAEEAFKKDPQKFLKESDTTFYSNKQYCKVSANYIVKIPK